MFPECTIQTTTLSRRAISQMDYTKSPQTRPRDTPFGSGIHHKASQENDVPGNVMVGIGVGRKTCIRDKDMDPSKGDRHCKIGFNRPSLNTAVARYFSRLWPIRVPTQFIQIMSSASAPCQAVATILSSEQKGCALNKLVLWCHLMCDIIHSFFVTLQLILATWGLFPWF